VLAASLSAFVGFGAPMGIDDRIVSHLTTCLPPLNLTPTLLVVRMRCGVSETAKVCTLTSTRSTVYSMILRASIIRRDRSCLSLLLFRSALVFQMGQSVPTDESSDWRLMAPMAGSASSRWSMAV
jgi:hypothetical protein